MVTLRMPRVTGYLYPWDILGDPGAAVEVAALGVDRAALAASYHSVRAATPRHPHRRLVDAHSAALYVPVADSAWAGQALVPGDAREWTGTDNSFAAAAQGLRGAGLEVDAWTVLTHSTRLGRANPQLCVRNAFGEVYSYALCPSQAEVRSYALTVVDQVLELGQPDGLILEAVGALGFAHQNRHEKTDGGDYGPAVQNLLSLCFCGACARAYGGRGLDPGSLASHVRDSIRALQRRSAAGTASGAAPGTDSPDRLIEPDLLNTFGEVLECRWDAAAALLEGVLDRARSHGVSRIAVDADPDLWATGPFLPAQALARTADSNSFVSVLQGWGSVEGGIGKLDAARQAVPGAGPYGAYVLTLPPKEASADQWVQDWRRLGEAGYEELHIYHLGLASDTRRAALTGALRALRMS
jgi:hypothetical protein